SFFYFAWREIFRSANLRKNMAAKGVLIFLGLYFSLVALMLGFNLNEFMGKSYPDQPLIPVFNSFIFVYIGIEFVIRIMAQALPTFGFQPFLILPVSRQRIAKYMLNKSLLHFFNFMPLLLIIPFTFKVAVKELDTVQLIVWLISLYLMIIVNHFLAIYIKWKTNESNVAFYGFLVLAAGIFAIDYFEIFDITGAFGKIYDYIIQNPLYVIIFPVVIIGLYKLNHNYLWSRFFLDEITHKKKKQSTHDFSWLNQVGSYGKMLSLEVKMIARNKRPRTSAMMSVIFIFYGLILYKGNEGNPPPEFVFVFGGMFMTGIFGMMYGQFFPAWHSRYYPFLMAQNVKMKQVLQSAFFLMAATNVVFYLLSLGYMFINPKVLYIHLVVMLYNIGVNSFVIFALGLTSRKSIDLDQRAMFNYQGMGAAQWLITFPILLGPMAVFGILYAIAGSTGAYIGLGVVGLTGIIFHPKLIDYFTKEYLNRKHKMIAAYKKS
ncbi:MAG: hypothetical protein JW833_15545, partial [Prolixibacteraceae bacterium]|nr:hypothetical protein [Prolixibacteraceae bacterium]